MKNVAAYIRVSTDGQCGEDRFGLESQRQQIVEYCAKNEMNIVKWFKDEGKSGAKWRPGFDEIVFGDVTNPPIEAVVVAKSDRVARDINIYFSYKGLLMRKNIELISISEDFGQFGLFAPALEALIAAMAEIERENINKRTAGGRKVKAANGGYSGGRPPYGYEARNGQLWIVPEEAEVVRYIINAKDAGATYKEICEKLNAAGKTNKSGTKFSISTLQVIIDNKPMYQGMYRYGKNGEWVKGQHEPILKDGE